MVDLQADFTEAENGSLAVTGADEAYLADVRNAMETYAKQGYPLYATQDWHPENHISFASNHAGVDPFTTIEINGRIQFMWPPHCVQNTPGADLLIPTDPLRAVVKKGSDPQYDSYSGFTDDGGVDTGLESILRQDGITDLIIFGLAADVCVKYTVLDARKAGFLVTVRRDLCRGVDPGDTESAVTEMSAAGAKISP